MSVRPLQQNPIVAEAAPRVHLAIQGGERDGTRIECRRVVTLIGARPGCKIRLDHPKVAPVHIALVNTGTDVLAVDLVTKYGSMLNGLKMEYERINHGDVMTVHPWSFRVEVSPSSRVDDDASALKADMPPVITLEHIDTGRSMKPTRELCLIGRRPGCDIVLSDRRVSRVHALLLSQNGQPALCDLLSANETIVNDTPVEFHHLHHDDVVIVGESRFRVRLADSDSAGQDRKNHRTADTDVISPPEDQTFDLVDIQAAESSQPWRIADKLDKLTKKP